LRYILLLIPILIGCSTHTRTENEIKSKITALDSSFVSPIMIYLLEDESIQESNIIASTSELLLEFVSVTDIPDRITKDGFQLQAMRKGDEDFMTVDMSLLPDTFLQLSEQETKALEGANRAIQIVFFGTRERVVAKQRAISQLVHRITDKKKVVIVDLSTFEFFNAALWKQSRVDPFNEEPLNITSQVTIHTYREEEFCRAVTLGMNKFCLPEVSIKHFPCSDQNSFGNLVNATCQTLFEYSSINTDSTLTVDLSAIKNTSLREFLLSSCKKNASQIVDLRLKYVDREEGDNYAPQFLISFESKDYSSPQEEANKIIANLFGAEDSVAYINHDEELLKASQRAKQQFPELKAQFNQGLAPGYSMMVKIPFATNNGGNEWMWVEVTKWKEIEMEGILQNDPYEIKDLKAGALIKFNESDIFDYLLNNPDGSFEGNETGKILESRGGN
jgi:uncharacterized protein YegJ (DUF2314 family)